MKRISVLGTLVFLSSLMAFAESVSFDSDKVGSIPKGWQTGAMGHGSPMWAVTTSEGALSRPNVLKQSGEADFPWAVKSDVSITDGFVEVKFKPVSGEDDQAGGIVWRFKDGNNYYVARGNALENNVSLYYTENGKRKTLKYVDAPVKLGEWNWLRAEFVGKRIKIVLNGKAYIEFDDDHILEPGSVGVWTKADSVTEFDDFSYGRNLASSPKEVVVYTSVDDIFARPIAEKFERQKGIRVKLVPDTEETKSTGLLNRLIAERDRPQADVFWSGDPVRAAILKAKGISIPYHSTEAEGLPKLFRDPAGHWTGFSSRARVLLYNKSAGFVPSSVIDLAEAKFKGKGCLANPLFGTTSMHAAALFQVMGEEKARRFFDAMAENGVRLLSSNGEVRRRVASGECGFGLLDTDDAFEAIRDGKPVEVVYPDQEGMGTLLVPNAAVLIARAPHSDAGKAFIDYLLSPETEKALAEGDAAQMPMRTGIRVPVHVHPIEKIKPMKVDYAELAPELESLSRGTLKEWVERMHQGTK